MLFRDELPRGAPFNIADEVSAFEVIATSNSAPTGRMNPQLVPLLEHAGGGKGSEGRATMVRLMLALQDEALARTLELTSATLSGPQLRSVRRELLDHALLAPSPHR